ncbi:MAG: hypothetical protein LAP39_03445 [Acidobacteriia bacterium]|nr:hypothetical protein [Terriglobia bacterium]
MEAGKWLPADAKKLKANFDELEAVFGMETTLAEDQQAILLAPFGEVTPEHYAGTRPPARSYEPAIYHEELFAFRWSSLFFSNHEMYFKFCLSGADEGRRAFICSIHEHRENQND